MRSAITSGSDRPCTRFPFAIGPDRTVLMLVGAGAIWVAALLAALLPVEAVHTNLVEPPRLGIGRDQPLDRQQRGQQRRDPVLMLVGAGAIWVAALLAALLPVERLVAPDAESG
jgi:ABC-type transport system involved in cytochrome c biogenesis permease component